MPSKSANVKNEKQYEALKDKGMSKERAAKIANSKDASKNGGKQSGKGGDSSQGGTTAQKKKAGRKGGKAAAKKSYGEPRHGGRRLVELAASLLLAVKPDRRLRSRHARWRLVADRRTARGLRRGLRCAHCRAGAAAARRRTGSSTATCRPCCVDAEKGVGKAGDAIGDEAAAARRARAVRHGDRPDRRGGEPGGDRRGSRWSTARRSGTTRSPTGWPTPPRR